MAEKGEVKTEEQDYRVLAEVWYGVAERCEKIVPPFILVTPYFRNKVFFVCNVDLFNVLIDHHVALYPEVEMGKNRPWVHGELESLYGFNLLVDSEAPEGGYFIDDRGARLDENDAWHWRELLRRWKEEEKKWYRNLRGRGKRFYGEIVGRIEDLKRRIGRRDLASHFLLVTRADYKLLAVGDAVVKKKHHIVRPHEVEEGLGIEVIVHSACRKGGMIIERPIPGGRNSTGVLRLFPPTVHLGET